MELGNKQYQPIEYVSDGKFAFFDGLRFCRDDQTGYYLYSTIRKRLHRYVWEYCFGAIPEGFDVHFINGKKSECDIWNLALMESREHESYHGKLLSAEHRESYLKNVIPAAIKWHKSTTGKAWHKEQYQRTKEQLHEKTQRVCAFCGKKYLAHHGRFCSNSCKAAERRQSGIDREERVCPVCGTHFQVEKYKKKVTCSRKCTNRWKKKGE